jgi:hypothetical protein
MLEKLPLDKMLKLWHVEWVLEWRVGELELMMVWKMELILALELKYGVELFLLLD